MVILKCGGTRLKQYNVQNYFSQRTKSEKSELTLPIRIMLRRQKLSYGYQCLYLLFLLNTEYFSMRVNGNQVHNYVTNLEIKARLNKNTTVVETFSTSTQENSIQTQFQLSDGVVCWLVYDFLNEIKIFKVDVLGEPELGQKQYQTMCFITKLESSDIIPSEAMAKLRQKSAGTVQEPNDILKSELLKTDVELLNLDSAPAIFRGKFRQMCTGHNSIVYAREDELYTLAKGDSEVLKTLKSGALRRSSDNSVPHCSPSMPMSRKFQPCICKVPFTVAWYPCLIKYCQSKNSLGNPITTRCGIRSCRKTFHLYFTVDHPLSCHWGIT